MLSNFECIIHSSLLSLEKNQIVTVNSIFPVSNFVRLILMSFKYGLILLRYSLTDSVLFLSSILSYSI